MSDVEREREPLPPPAERVACRALVLAAVAARSFVETQRSSEDSTAFQQDLVAWLDEIGAGAECEPRERRLLEAPVGTLSAADAVNGSWDAEAMVVLAWALGRVELPAFDAPCKPRVVADALGFWQERAQSVLCAPSLRGPAEIDALANALFAVHWRLREFSLRRTAMDFRASAEHAWFGPLDLSGVPLVEDDLAIDGAPLAPVPEQRWRECLSIAAERHRAVNWLLGYEPVYADVTADT